MSVVSFPAESNALLRQRFRTILKGGGNYTQRLTFSLNETAQIPRSAPSFRSGKARTTANE
jgi:hypothetical protein